MSPQAWVSGPAVKRTEPKCPNPACENVVPEDSVWMFRGQFYCSQSCGEAVSFKRAGETPPGYHLD